MTRLTRPIGITGLGFLVAGWALVQFDAPLAAIVACFGSSATIVAVAALLSSSGLHRRLGQMEDDSRHAVALARKRREEDQRRHKAIREINNSVTRIEKTTARIPEVADLADDIRVTTFSALKGPTAAWAPLTDGSGRLVSLTVVENALLEWHAKQRKQVTGVVVGTYAAITRLHRLLRGVSPAVRLLALPIASHQGSNELEFGLLDDIEVLDTQWALVQRTTDGDWVYRPQLRGTERLPDLSFAAIADMPLTSSSRVATPLPQSLLPSSGQLPVFADFHKLHVAQAVAVWAAEENLAVSGTSMTLRTATKES